MLTKVLRVKDKMNAAELFLINFWDGYFQGLELVLKLTHFIVVGVL